LSMIWFDGVQRTVDCNRAIQSAVGFEVIRTFVLRWMGFQKGADICDEFPLTGLLVHSGNAARAVRIAVGTTAARDYGIQRAIQEYDIRHPDQVAHCILR